MIPKLVHLLVVVSMCSSSGELSAPDFLASVRRFFRAPARVSWNTFENLIDEWKTRGRLTEAEVVCILGTPHRRNNADAFYGLYPDTRPIVWIPFVTYTTSIEVGYNEKRRVTSIGIAEVRNGRIGQFLSWLGSLSQSGNSLQ